MDRSHTPISCRSADRFHVYPRGRRVSVSNRQNRLFIPARGTRAPNDLRRIVPTPESSRRIVDVGSQTRTRTGRCFTPRFESWRGRIHSPRAGPNTSSGRRRFLSLGSHYLKSFHSIRPIQEGAIGTPETLEILPLERSLTDWRALQQNQRTRMLRNTPCVFGVFVVAGSKGMSRI